MCPMHPVSLHDGDPPFLSLCLSPSPLSWRVLGLHPMAFFLPYFLRGDRMLLALEKSTPASTSSCLSGSLIPQECSQRANNGRFTLRDLLMVPMQRVLKYHLLLQVHSWGPPRSKDYGRGISTSPCHRSEGGAGFWRLDARASGGGRRGHWDHAWPPSRRREEELVGQAGLEGLGREDRPG